MASSLLSKFDKECLRNVNARVFTNKMWTDGRLTKTDPKPHLSNQAKNVTSRVFTRFLYSRTWKTAPPPPPGGHFHDDWAKNETSRENAPPPPGGHKTAPPTGSHVFFTDLNHFQTRDINKTNVLTKFHDDWAKIVTSRVFTRYLYRRTPPTAHIETPNAPPPGGHVFQQTCTTFELNQLIIKTNILTNFKLNRGMIGTNLLTKFHKDRTRNVASRVFTRKTAPPTGGHVFQRTATTFELNQHIIKTNILTNFKLNRDFIGTNLLTKIYEDRTRNVASRVFTRKTAPSTGGHRNILTYFELDRGIIGTKLLTKFHEDRTRNVASRVFTNKCGRRTDRRRTKTDHKNSPEPSGQQYSGR
ncbi:hypothetical protein DPMN_118826 [Dreissena polymorpha]|uniref:Uncharacterized protein n=1 Tax=Dreissena polymorpha TaxID=45954 RepID=A0A9D4JQM3_DREPO|nr:hypothetical protein DPMN_118826 [Dreissena polymorpha]